MTCHYTPSELQYANQLADKHTQMAASNLGVAYQHMAELCSPVEIAELEEACDPREQDRIWRLICETAQS